MGEENSTMKTVTILLTKYSDLFGSFISVISGNGYSHASILLIAVLMRKNKMNKIVLLAKSGSDIPPDVARDVIGGRKRSGVTGRRQRRMVLMSTVIMKDGGDKGNKMFFAPPVTYDEIMKKIPKGFLTTVGEIRSYLVKDNNADFTDPMTAGILFPLSHGRVSKGIMTKLHIGEP